MMANTKRLSEDQKDTLRLLYEMHVQYKEAESHPAYDGDLMVDTFGVPWSVEGDRSFQASSSRGLRRLEDRGLLLRQNVWCTGEPGTDQCRESKEDPHDRTTHVRLLPAGIEVAKRLSQRT